MLWVSSDILNDTSLEAHNMYICNWTFLGCGANDGHLLPHASGPDNLLWKQSNVAAFCVLRKTAWTYCQGIHSTVYWGIGVNQREFLHDIFTMMRLPTGAFYVLAIYSKHFDIVARFLLLQTDFAQIWQDTKVWLWHRLCRAVHNFFHVGGQCH